MTKVSKHIILVEDNPDDAELIQLELDKLDIPIQIHRASGMEDFKALLEKITPDLIMSDYNLGDCNGLDIFSVVKERVLHPPFIIVSGYIGEEKAVEAVKQGIDDYVLKDHLARLQPVTERLLLASKSEENRRLWEHIFFSVIENTAVGLLLLDESLNIVMTNQLITEMSGYTEKELIGQSSSILYPENMEESWSREVKGLQNSGEGSASHEWLLNKKDHSFRHVHSTLTLITVKENKKYILSFVTDVTEYKREDRMLRQTESISGVGGWQYNVLDDSVFLTKKAIEIFGLAQKKETDLDVDRLIAKFEEESQKKIREAMSAAISQNESYRLECRLNSKDQRKINIIEITGQPVVASGKTVMLYGSIEDITEKKEQQQEMQKLSMVARKTENAVIITDAEVNIEWVNEAFTRLTEYSLEEVEGKNPGDLLQGPLTEPETVARMHQHIKAKVGFTEEVINYTKSGKPYWIRITVTPLLDEGGHLKQFFSIQEDITERKQAENDLKEAEQHYRQIIEHSTNLFYQHDPNHVFTYLSPQSKQFLGIPAESIDCIWTDFVTDNPANRRGKELTEKAIETGETQPSHELEIRKANGEICWVQVNEGPVVNDGKTTSIVGSLTDITELKKSKQETEVLLQEVHHRVKNNLAIISGLLQLEEFQTDNEDLILPLRHSQNRIKSMAKVHELLYRKQQFSSINIGDYLEEMTETIEKTISDGQKADVNIKADGHELNVNSAIPLGMLLNELISNSFKYAFTNGTKGRIDIEVKNLGDQKFSVHYRDNGKGMESNLTLESPNSLGLTLIKTLLTQLEADYQLDTKNKFELSFTFEEVQRGAHSLI